MLGYADPKSCQELADRIAQSLTGGLRFMEVCGTHAVLLLRTGNNEATNNAGLSSLAWMYHSSFQGTPLERLVLMALAIFFFLIPDSSLV
jgi:hypothetical protein